MRPGFKGTATDVKNAEVLAGLAEREFPAEEFETFQKLFLTKEGKTQSQGRQKKGAPAACPRLEEIFYREAENLSELEAKSLVCGFLRADGGGSEFGGGTYRRLCNCYKKIHSKMDYEDLIVLTRDCWKTKSVADCVLRLDGRY